MPEEDGDGRPEAYRGRGRTAEARSKPEAGGERRAETAAGRREPQTRPVADCNTPGLRRGMGPGSVARWSMIGTLNLGPHTHLELSGPSAELITNV